MNNQLYVFGLILILILSLIYLYKSGTEKFDTYRNHDEGAYNVYNSDFIIPKGNKLETFGKKNVEDAALLSKYTWNVRDPEGNNVYDRYYEALTNEKNNSDPDYSYRDTDNDLNSVYDTKFSTLTNNNELATYPINCMQDQNHVQTVFNGEVITLVQEQY